MDDTFISTQKVRFTKRTIQQMHKFMREIIDQGGKTISYALVRDVEGKLTASLGGDYDPPTNAIPDEIEGLKFYWYADPDLLADVRDCIVNLPLDGPTELIQIGGS
jgi:hypothetical protein